MDVTSSLARTTWLIEERERLDARRRDTRVSSGVEVVEAEGGERLSVDEAILYLYRGQDLETSLVLSSEMRREKATWTFFHQIGYCLMYDRQA